MKDLLFLGLAKRSTGEITYTIRQLQNCPENLNEVICINSVQKNIVKNHKRAVSFHDFSDLPFHELIENLYSLCKEYKYIVFIDLNCFFLEHNIKFEQQKLFFQTAENLCLEGKQCAFTDYFGSFVYEQEEFQRRIKYASERLEEKISGLPVNNRLGWYLRKFVPERMKMQLIKINKNYSLFAPVPLNCCSGIQKYFYSNNICPSKKAVFKKRKTVLFALSGFFTYTIEKNILNNLCISIFNKLSSVLDIDKIICIDPLKTITDSLNSTKTKLQLVKYIEQEQLSELLNEVLFTGLFVPYGTLGTISLNNGIPFVSFIASSSSIKNKIYGKMVLETPLPGFNALGLWEDEVFFPELRKDNKYFDSVYFLDICKEGAFEELAANIENKYLFDKAAGYYNIKEDIKCPTFFEAINLWKTGK